VRAGHKTELYESPRGLKLCTQVEPIGDDVTEESHRGSLREDYTHSKRASQAPAKDFGELNSVRSRSGRSAVTPRFSQPAFLEVPEEGMIVCLSGVANATSAEARTHSSGHMEQIWAERRPGGRYSESSRVKGGGRLIKFQHSAAVSGLWKQTIKINSSVRRNSL